MLFTSPKLTGLVLLIVPAVIVPIVVLGRRLRVLSRENQDWIAASSGNASEALLSVQTVQAFTHDALGRAAFADVTEKSFDSAKRGSDRAVMTVIVIFAGLLGHRRRALDRRARCARRADDRGRAGAVRDLRDHGRRRGRRAVEIWGELQRAAGRHRAAGGAAERRGHRAGPGPGRRCRRPGAGEIEFDDVASHYPTRPESRRWTGSPSPSARARRWRWSAPRARASPRSSSFCCASTIPFGAHHAGRRAPDRHARADFRARSRWCRRTR
jgi:ATP-binding cassette subfamily B protein